MFPKAKGILEKHALDQVDAKPMESTS